MMDSTFSPFRPFRTALALAACALAALPALSRNHDRIVNPIAPGKFPVACSNLQMDASRVAPGVLIDEYWEGKNGHYLTELLAQPQATLRVDALVPDDRRLYPQNAGGRVPHVVVVCHPTPRDNPDPDYALPGSTSKVPHMLPPGQAPRLMSVDQYTNILGYSLDPPPPGPYPMPLIVYSHGLSGSPIGKGYIDVMVQLAAQGYMVAAVFHGDPRFSRVRLQDFGDFAYALLNFDRVVEMQLMRPVALKAMTDMLLAHPGYAGGIDETRIGGFGASMGGQAMAHLLGARITSSLNRACSETVRDDRIKAAFGFVPYSGQSFLPAFCDDQSGAEQVTRPYLAMAGTADTTAPIGMTRQAVNRFSGTHYLVEMQGGEHELRAEDVGDVFTWMVTFFNAYLDVHADPGAMARLIRMKGVTGGYPDEMTIDVHKPFAEAAGETTVLEFYNTELKHYLVVSEKNEIAAILAGRAGAGWGLTGQAFKAYPGMPSDTMSPVFPVCRFYGVPAGGPNSHFYTADPTECEFVKKAGGWHYEGIGFYIQRAFAPDRNCPDGLLAVNRAYNNGYPKIESNHRFTTSESTMAQMRREGWADEGTVMCARP
jgi:predicted dienelactone hydrolase